MSFIKDYSRSFQGYIIIMFNYTEVKNFCTLLYVLTSNATPSTSTAQLQKSLYNQINQNLIDI